MEETFGKQYIIKAGTTCVMSFGSDSGGTFVKGTTYRFNISAGVEKAGIFLGKKEVK